MEIFCFLYPWNSVVSFPIFLKDEEAEEYDCNGGMDERDANGGGDNLHSCGSSSDTDMGRAQKHEERFKRRKRTPRRRRNCTGNAPLSEG